MSANQAMSSARRRRGTLPTAPHSAAGTTSAPRGNVKRSAPDQPPKPSPPVHPLALVLQHDRRLFELEQQVPMALDAMSSNIEVLTQGYNSLTARSGGEPILTLSDDNGKPLHDPRTELAMIDTKVNTALSEALTSKTLATNTAAALESLRINDIREVRAMNEELKAEMAELRSVIRELTSNDGIAEEVTLSVEQ